VGVRKRGSGRGIVKLVAERVLCVRGLGKSPLSTPRPQPHNASFTLDPLAPPNRAPANAPMRT